MTKLPGLTRSLIASPMFRRPGKEETSRALPLTVTVHDRPGPTLTRKHTIMIVRVLGGIFAKSYVFKDY